jgi:hypothetical protein
MLSNHGVAMSFPGPRGRPGSNGITYNTGAATIGTTSTSTTLESTLLSVSFVVPPSGIVHLAASGAGSTTIDGGELEYYMDLVSVASARTLFMGHGRTSAPRVGFSMHFRKSGLTAGATVVARIRWRTTAGTRACSPGTNSKEYARLDVFNE